MDQLENSSSVSNSDDSESYHERLSACTSKLSKFYIRDCHKLQSLPEIPPSLQFIFARNCTSLETIFGLSLSNDFCEEKFFLSSSRFDCRNCMKLNEIARRIIIRKAEQIVHLIALNRVRENHQVFLLSLIFSERWNKSPQFTLSIFYCLLF